MSKPSTDLQLYIQDLSLGYSGLSLVKNINLSIFTGDFWAIVGPNGQGKSTLVKALMGLINPNSGKIIYENIKKNELGYIPQASSTQSNLPITIAEFVALSAPGFPFSKKRKNAVNQALESVWLGDKKKRLYNTLSGGEKQRLHIARALVRKPKLLILDEPDIGLDFTSMGNLLDLLKDLNDKQKITILFITHNLQLAQKVSKKAALLHRQKIISGKTAEVLTKENIISAFSQENAAEGSVEKWLSEH